MKNERAEELIDALEHAAKSCGDPISVYEDALGTANAEVD
jgi:hypothetical protein